MFEIEPTVDDKSIYDDGIFYRLFDEAEIVRWRMVDLPWSSIRKHDVSPAWIALAREMLVGELTTFSGTERFFADFADDVDFTQWVSVWLYEETKHPSVFLKWLDALGEKFDSRFMLQGRPTQWATRPASRRVVEGGQEIPTKPDSMPTLATNVLSEMLAATFYTTVAAQPGIEPVLSQICRKVGGDEARHAAGFYSYAKKRIARSEHPANEKTGALKVLYFWTDPDLNQRVGHPVNLLVNRCMASPLIQEAVPLEALRAGAENVRKRACRVFESLLGLELRSVNDVSQQLAALEN